MIILCSAAEEPAADCPDWPDCFDCPALPPLPEVFREELKSLEDLPDLLAEEERCFFFFCSWNREVVEEREVVSVAAV